MEKNKLYFSLYSKNELENDILEMRLEDINVRHCNECGKEMWDGFCIESGMEYYCSEECLHKNISEEEYNELYDDGNGDSYWTDWYDEYEEYKRLMIGYKIIIDDEENYIGYVKDIRKFLHNAIEEQTKDWNNNEDNICNITHILYEFRCNYADDDLVKISDCPMDEYGIKIEELEVK